MKDESLPEQPVFVGETAVDERTAVRLKGWGLRGKRAYKRANLVRVGLPHEIPVLID